MSSRREGLFAGVDVGGTTVDAVVVDGEKVVASISHPMYADDLDRVLSSVVGALRAVRNDLPPGAGDIEGIGLGVPGLVDTAGGSVRLAMNINIGEDAFPIGPKVEAEFGIPTTVENDVRAAALGAFERFAATHDLHTLAFIGIGTGISAGLVVEGRVHRGRDGMAGEIGHVPVVKDGPTCRCGLTGCLEAVAAGPAIARLWPSDDGRHAEVLFRAAAAGDARAVETAAVIAGHLATAVHLVSSAYDPDLIVLGGGVGSVGDPLLSAVKSALAGPARRSPLFRHLVSPDRLVSVPTNHAIGAIGAAAVARQRDGGEGTEVGGAEHSSSGGRTP